MRHEKREIDHLENPKCENTNNQSMTLLCVHIQDRAYASQPGGPSKERPEG